MMTRQVLQFAQTIVDPNRIQTPKVAADQSQVATILGIVFTIAGVVCVIVIAIAGLSYVLSAGDPGKTAKAKDAILYAVIGLVVSILSFTIVAFVLGRFF